MPWISLPGSPGKIVVSDVDYQSTYRGAGWVLTSAPVGVDFTPPSNWVHYAGDWQSITWYDKGTIVQTPGGGMLQAPAQLITDADFSETGWVRLTPDGLSGVTAADSPPSDPLPNALWWDTSGSPGLERMFRWDVDAGDWLILTVGTGGGTGVTTLKALTDVAITADPPTGGIPILAYDASSGQWTWALLPTLGVLYDSAGAGWMLAVSTAGVLSTIPVGGTAPGVTQPDSTNTGYAPTGAVLTSVAGSVTLSTPGEVYENKDVSGRIFIKAANVTVRSCRVRGNDSGSANTALIVCTDQSCVNATIQDCTLKPDTSTVWLDAIMGHDFTALRCNMYGVVDGVGIYNSNSGHTADRLNVSVLACYVHDLAYRSPDENHSDNHTHNDCIQIQGGYVAATVTAGDVIIKGNTLLCGVGPAPISNATSPYAPAAVGSVIAATPNVSALGNIVVDGNWMDGGAQCLTFILGSKGFGGPVVIANNLFGTSSGLTIPTLTKNGTSAQRPILIDSAIVSAHMTGWATGRVTDSHNNRLVSSGALVTDDSYAGAS